MSEAISAHRLLTEFIENERGRFESEHNNRFAFSFSTIVTYRRFLDLIVARFEPVSVQYGAAVTEKLHLAQAQPANGRPLTPRELELLAEISELQDLLHLDIESFYQFAKILLDKTAHSFGVYFGQQRSCSFGSFSRFTKALALLGPPFAITDEFRAECAHMEREISDYRDKRVVHEQRAELVQAVTITNGRTFSLSPACIRAKALEDFEGSKDPRELIPLIDTYLSHYIDCIRRNAALTKLRVSLPPAS